MRSQGKEKKREERLERKKKKQEEKKKKERAKAEQEELDNIETKAKQKREDVKERHRLGKAMYSVLKYTPLYPSFVLFEPDLFFTLLILKLFCYLHSGIGRDTKIYQT